MIYVPNTRFSTEEQCKANFSKSAKFGGGDGGSGLAMIGKRQ